MPSMPPTESNTKPPVGYHPLKRGGKVMSMKPFLLGIASDSFQQKQTYYSGYIFAFLACRAAPGTTLRASGVFNSLTRDAE